MSALLEIVGAIHLVAYALIGFSFVSALFTDWIVRRFKLKADMLRIAHRMYLERSERARAAGDAS